MSGEPIDEQALGADAGSKAVAEGMESSAADSKTREALLLEKLALENQRAKKELNAFGRPTKWEVAKSLVTFFGVLVPVLITVFTFLHQRDIELAQKQQAFRAERLRAMERARELIAKGDRSAGVFQLALFGEDAIPDLIGEVRINNNHADWPSPSLAALTSLKADWHQMAYRH